jgi:hypothetical protein
MVPRACYQTPTLVWKKNLLRQIDWFIENELASLLEDVKVQLHSKILH